MPRELIDTGTDKRYVRRDEDGQFKESDDVGRSLSAGPEARREDQGRRRARATGGPMTRPALERYSNRSKMWDATEIERMRTLFERETPMPEMAAMLGRTQESIRTKARKIGV